MIESLMVWATFWVTLVITLDNTGRNESAFMDEIGNDMVAYCVNGTKNGYAYYRTILSTLEIAEMYYEDVIVLNARDIGSGYVIYVGSPKWMRAYCLDETNPLDSTD